jgi:hypothetical protein
LKVIQNTCHENISHSICLNILHEDDLFKLEIYLKILNNVDLTGAIYSTVKKLKQLSVEIVEVNFIGLYLFIKLNSLNFFFKNSTLPTHRLKNMHKNSMKKLSLYWINFHTKFKFEKKYK